MAERGRTTARHKGRGRSRRSQANGSAAPATPEQRQHNIGGSVPDEVYDRHLKLIEVKWNARRRAHESFKKMDGEYRAAKKVAKEDGCNIGAIDLANDLDKMDHAEVQLLYRETGRVLRLKESKLAVQLKLFDDVPAPSPVNPVLAGEVAGKRGDPRDNNPHQPGTEAYALYDEAWMRGVDATRESLTRA